MTATLEERSAAVIRILLVDDHTILREGLAKLLANEPDLEICGEASDGRIAVDKATELTPDVVVMDLAMPGLNGLDATRRVLKACPRTRVLALSNHFDNEYVGQAFEAGVSGYLLKDAAVRELARGIREVAEGRTCLGGGLDAEMVERLLQKRRRARREGPNLTHREREVMKLLAEGHTVKTVAELLGLSQKTVDTHKTNLMKKLGIHNRVELVRYALREKLIQL